MSLQSPVIKYTYDRYKKASSTRKAVIEMVITYRRKQKYLSTGISVFPKQWKDGMVVGTPDALLLNSILDKMLIDVREIIIEMSKEGNIDLFAIPQRLEVKNNRLTFIEFCSKRASIRKYGKEEDTQKRYDRFLRFFKEWGGIVSFNDITEENIIRYDKFLKKKEMTNYSKWHNYHRFLNSFIIDAISEGYIRKNPYYWINIEKGDSYSGLDKCLTPREFDRLKNTKMPTASLERVKDLFIFQTYTCLRYSDLAKFDYNNIVVINGIKTYKCLQKKTKKEATIPLPKAALDILYKYNNVLPIISNVKYNAYLKVVAQAAGLDYNLSTHWARHTGATMLLNDGVDMKIVSKICGHSSVRITEQVYAKLLDETVVDVIKNLDNQ